MSEPLIVAALEGGGAVIKDDAQDNLTVDELRTSIGSLSQADKLRLHKAARILCGGTRFEWNDLFNEAVARALTGKRHCPREVAVVQFLANVMRSIASAARISQAREPETRSLSATGTEGAAAENVAAPERHPEQLAVARQECEAMLAAIDLLFGDDEEAQMVLMGDMDGLGAEAIRDMQGWNLQQYATVRRRIKRKINERFPKGFVRGA